MQGFESTPPDVRALLSQRISQLGLKLEGSPVERYVRELYRHLDRKGLRRFRPPCYLTDAWGCPDGEPIIGIPFYLADTKLARLALACGTNTSTDCLVVLPDESVTSTVMV